MTTGERFTAVYTERLAAATTTAADQFAECAETCLAQAERAPESCQAALLVVASLYENIANAMRQTVSAHLGAP